MAKFKEYLEFKDWYAQKESVYGDDAPTYFSQFANRLSDLKVAYKCN